MNTLDDLTRLAFPWALAWFLLLLALRTAVVLRRGYKLELGTPKGDPRRGILYSLTFSMLPWKKDSTRRHPWTYAAGMGMHLGIFLTVVFALGLGGCWDAPITVPIVSTVGTPDASTINPDVRLYTCYNPDTGKVYENDGPDCPSGHKRVN